MSKFSKLLMTLSIPDVVVHLSTTLGGTVTRTRRSDDGLTNIAALSALLKTVFKKPFKIKCFETGNVPFNV